MYGVPAPAAARRFFTLSVTVDAELLRAEPGLAEALRKRLEDGLDPATMVNVSGGDLAGFTVEASSDDDVEELGPRGSQQLDAALQWIEDQATAILDRILFPTEVASPAVRAGMATVLALAGRAALALLLVVAGSGGASAEEAAPTLFRAMFYGHAPGVAPDLEALQALPPQDEITVRLNVRCRLSLIEHAAAMYLPGALSDELTTEYFLAQGGHEMNPVMRSRWARLPLKLVAEPMAGAALERWVQSRWGRTAALAFRGVMWATRAGLAIHNIRYGNSLRSGR